MACPEGLVNYWGYQPVAYFAPHPKYRSRRDPLGPVNEFRDMVKALHQVGIEVILDVVYNHTVEGNQDGPTSCFRGIDNPSYYHTTFLSMAENATRIIQAAGTL